MPTAPSVLLCAPWPPLGFGKCSLACHPDPTPGSSSLTSRLRAELAAPDVSKRGVASPSNARANWLPQESASPHHRLTILINPWTILINPWRLRTHDPGTRWRRRLDRNVRASCAMSSLEPTIDLLTAVATFGILAKRVVYLFPHELGWTAPLSADMQLESISGRLAIC